MTLYSAAVVRDMLRAMRVGPFISSNLSPSESAYVVVVPFKGRNGLSERVAYGLTISLSKRAAGQLARAVQPHYKHGKNRAIMLKTAVKDGLI